MKRNIEIKKGSAVKTLGKLLRYMAHYYKWEFLLVVFCIIVNAVAGISSSVFLEMLVDEVITPGLSLGLAPTQKATSFLPCQPGRRRLNQASLLTPPAQSQLPNTMAS